MCSNEKPQHNIELYRFQIAHRYTHTHDGNDRQSGSAYCIPLPQNYRNNTMNAIGGNEFTNHSFDIIKSMQAQRTHTQSRKIH